MLKKNEASSIADLFYLLDTNVRADLHRGQIADERDYVSRLVATFNYPFGLFNQLLYNHFRFQSKWFSKVNNSPDEKRFGCDSIIVFQVGNKVKIGLFEAKWCRTINDPAYKWDYPQKSTKQSHFTDQIKRQSRWSKQAAIWEMFFYEQEVGKFDKPFDRNASTCILHKFAKKLISQSSSLKTIWNNDDLVRLIESAQSTYFDGENETNIKDIIYNILFCKYGKPIILSPTDRTIILRSNNGQETAEIPVVDFEREDQVEQRIDEFLSENGLSFFQYLKIN